MLRTLLESNATPIRRMGGTAFSVGAHTAVVGLAIAATARATAVPKPQEPIKDVVYRAEPLTRLPVEHRPPDRGALTPVVVCQCIIPPLTIPKTLPTVNYSTSITDAHDFDGSHIVAGGALGDAGMAGPAIANDSVYTAFAVEKSAMPRRDNPAPIYPTALRAASLEGIVVARFVVDTTGRAEPRSITFTATTHPLFADAVRQALLRSRYRPAMIGSRPVRQLVEQRFAFTLDR